jgi:hypothetical protein
LTTFVASLSAALKKVDMDTALAAVSVPDVEINPE